MIIFKQKPLEEILGYLADDKSIFLLRCWGCTKVNQAVAEEDLLDIKRRIEESGIEITGFAIEAFLCIKAKSVLGNLAEALRNPKSILVMACGLGVQSIAEVTDKVVHPACNSFADEDSIHFGKKLYRCLTCGDCVLEVTDSICPLTICHKGLFSGSCVCFEQHKRGYRCLTCGDCVLEFTGGICPLTVCSKELLNGPCGGSSDAKCEISKDVDCGWLLIYERMKKLGRLDVLKAYLTPKDHRTIKK